MAAFELDLVYCSFRLCFASRSWSRQGLLHPRPHELEEGTGHTFATTNLTCPYWIYLAAGSLIAAGFADFALIGFHFQKANTVPANMIPVFYAVAMASSALASIPLGRLFDRFGPNISLFPFLISAAAAPFVFLGTSIAAFDRDDFLGNRNGRGGFSASSDADRSDCATS